MKNHINLLTLECRRRQLVRQHMARWIRATGLVAALVFVGYWRLNSDLTAIQARFEPLDQRAEVFRQRSAENRRLEDQIALAQQRKLLFNSLSLPRQPLQLVGIISASSRAQAGKVRIASFELAPQEIAVAAEPVKRRPGPRRPVRNPEDRKPVSRTTLNLSGIAEDDLALAHFVASLREAGVFVEVELKSSRQVIDDERVARQYEVSCIY